MKLWLLRPVEGLPTDSRYGDGHEDNPWDPWYDKTFGFVIRAETEERAREIAQSEKGAETDYGRGPVGGFPAWTDARYSTCIELTADGDEGVIIKDTHSA